MEKKQTSNYRGIRPAMLVNVLEGNGTVDAPYHKVEYVIVYQEINGIVRQITLGKVAYLTDEEKNGWD